MGAGTSPDREQGPFLGKYRLLARLGTGGMAEVLLARLDGPSGFVKHFAIKRMRPELTSHQEFIDLFIEEARTASLLSHPNICQVNELHTADGDFFMVLEYLEGVAVSSVLVKALSNPEQLPIPFLVSIIQQAAEGLHYAHEMADDEGRPYHIIHRDISPPNLYMTTDGVVKVLDFGISKSRDSVVKTLTGQIRGKFAYMSPEQLRGEKLDRRSDVFSLAIVLFELLGGCRLFRRKSRLEVFRAIVKEPIPSVREMRPDLPTGLTSAIDQALARDRNDRMASARAFGDALAAGLSELGGPMSVQEVGALIGELFTEELKSRRLLLARPPGVELTGAAPTPVVEAVDPTNPTANLRIPHTVPDAQAPEDTHVETGLWSRAEVTSVEIGAGDSAVIGVATDATDSTEGDSESDPDQN